MVMVPTAIIFIWFSGLLSLGIIAGAVYSLREWYQTAWVYDSLLDRMVFNPDIGLNAPTALLVGGLLLVIWAVAGGLLVRLFLRLTSRNSTHDQPRLRAMGASKGCDDQMELSFKSSATGERMAQLLYSLTAGEQIVPSGIISSGS